jgi:hypothetical protein
MKAFSSAINPTTEHKQQMGAPSRIGDGNVFHSFKTDSYKLHYYECPSGLKVCCGHWLTPLSIKHLFIKTDVLQPFILVGCCSLSCAQPQT